MIGKTIDLFTTYQFLKRLVQPFEKWEAYKLGIIDEKGTVLRPMDSLETTKERDAWGYFDVLAANLKKLLGVLPGGKSAIASYAAAFLLLREEQHLNAEEIEDVLARLEETFQECLAEATDYVYSEEIANVASSGAVAGLGVGEQGEPPKKKTQELLKRIKRHGIS